MYKVNTSILRRNDTSMCLRINKEITKEEVHGLLTLVVSWIAIMVGTCVDFVDAMRQKGYSLTTYSQ